MSVKKKSVKELMEELGVEGVRDELRKLTYPGLHGFSVKDRTSICNMLRWLTLYRALQNNPLPIPTGTMLELVLMLDLFVDAWYDFNFMANDIPINDYISPLPVGDLAGLALNLKNKAVSLAPKILNSTIMPQPVGMEEDMAPTFVWFVNYRKLKNDAIPIPLGTACECLMILDLTEKALLDYSVPSTIRDAMDVKRVLKIADIRASAWKSMAF